MSGPSAAARVAEPVALVLAVLLHAPDRWWDSVGLLELAFEEARSPPR